MRVASLLAAVLTLVASTSAYSFAPTRVNSKRAVLNNICANLDVVLPGTTVAGITVTPGIDLGTNCICATPGGLTPNTILALRTDLLSSTNVPLLKALGETVDGAITVLTPILDNAFVGLTTTCNYPANSIPVGCDGSCGYECAENFFAGPDNTCIAGASAANRRRRNNFIPAGACPNTMQACSVIGISGRRTSQFECLNVRSNIESCGGCLLPFSNQALGQDCTLIPNVEGVACVQGRCVVSQCSGGLVVDPTRSECVSYVAVEQM